MDYSEKDIEESLTDYPGLIEQLKINPIGSQVVVEHGIIDILAYDPHDKTLVVIELKKGIVDENAVGQIMRYMSDIVSLKNWIKENPDLPLETQGIQGVKGILMGTNATPGVEAIIQTFPFLSFYQLHITLPVLVVPWYCNAKPCSTKTIESFMSTEPDQQIVYAHEHIFPKE